MNIRKATPADALVLAQIVYDAGTEGLDYVFRTQSRSAYDFLYYALHKEGGEFGYGCHYVFEENGKVIGGGASFSSDDTLRFLWHNGLRILRFYPFPVSLFVILRGLRIERILIPPKKNIQYLAHISILPEYRSKKYGSAFINQLVELRTKKISELDVAYTNQRAFCLYERLGFGVKWRKDSHLRRKEITVPGYIRMTKK